MWFVSKLVNFFIKADYKHTHKIFSNMFTFYQRETNSRTHFSNYIQKFIFMYIFEATYSNNTKIFTLFLVSFNSIFLFLFTFLLISCHPYSTGKQLHDSVLPQQLHDSVLPQQLMFHSSGSLELLDKKN
jgi:hypothetical protein